MPFNLIYVPLAFMAVAPVWDHTLRIYKPCLVFSLFCCNKRNRNYFSCFNPTFLIQTYWIHSVGKNSRKQCGPPSPDGLAQAPRPPLQASILSWAGWKLGEQWVWRAVVCMKEGSWQRRAISTSWAACWPALDSGGAMPPLGIFELLLAYYLLQY